jgi:hypothetical protein
MWYYIELNAENIIEFLIEAIEIIAIAWLIYKVKIANNSHDSR